MSKMKHMALMMGLAAIMGPEPMSITPMGHARKLDDPTPEPPMRKEFEPLEDRIKAFKKDCLSGVEGKDTQFIIAYKEDSIPVIAYNLKRANQKLNRLLRKHYLEALMNITDTKEWMEAIV